MCTVTIPFDQWAVDYHSTMAAVSEVGTAIKSGSSILGLVKDFWRVDRKFRALISDLEKIRQMPPDQLRNMTDKLIALSETVDQVLIMASRKGLTNRTLVNGSIQSLRKR